MKKYYSLIIVLLALAHVSCKHTKNSDTGNDSSTNAATTKVDTGTSAQKFSQEPLDADSTMREKSGTTGAADNTLTSSSDGNGASKNVGQRNPEKIVTETSGSTGAAENVLPATPGTNTGANANHEKLFSYLEMTEEQVRKFESGMDNFRKSVSQASEVKNRHNVEEEQRRQLKSILSQEQYKKYQKWEAESQ